MLEFLLHDGLRPFMIAAAFVVFMLVFEILLVSFGLSSAGESGGADIEGPGVDNALGAMSPAEISAELDIDPGVAEMISAELSADPEFEATPASEAQEVSTGWGLFDILGMRHVPLTIWIAIFSASFASTGIAVQSAVYAVLGHMLPLWLAGPAGLFGAIVLSRNLAYWVSLLLPRDETSAC